MKAEVSKLQCRYKLNIEKDAEKKSASFFCAPIDNCEYTVYSVNINSKSRISATRSKARKRSRDSFPAERRGLGQSPI